MLREKGQKVRIKNDLIVDDEYGKFNVLEEMKNYLGEEAKITHAGKDYYDLDIDDGIWCWTDEMLEDIEEEQKPIDLTDNDIEVGEQYIVIENRCSYYGSCEDLQEIEGQIITVTRDCEDGDFEITDNEGKTHICRPCNLKRTEEEPIGNEEFQRLVKEMTREEFLNAFKLQNECPKELYDIEEYCEFERCRDCCAKAIENVKFKDDLNHECTVTEEESQEQIEDSAYSFMDEAMSDLYEAEELNKRYKELVKLLVQELEDNENSNFFTYLGKFRPDLFQLT